MTVFVLLGIALSPELLRTVFESTGELGVALLAKEMHPQLVVSSHILATVGTEELKTSEQMT